MRSWLLCSKKRDAIIDERLKLQAERDQKIQDMTRDGSEYFLLVNKLQTMKDQLKDAETEVNDGRRTLETVQKDLDKGLLSLPPAERAQARGLQRMSAVMKDTAVKYTPFSMELRDVQKCLKAIQDLADELEEPPEDAEEEAEEKSVAPSPELLVDFLEAADELENLLTGTHTVFSILRQIGKRHLQALVMPKVDPCRASSMDMLVDNPQLPSLATRQPKGVPVVQMLCDA